MEFPSYMDSFPHKDVVHSLKCWKCLMDQMKLIIHLCRFGVQSSHWILFCSELILISFVILICSQVFEKCIISYIFSKHCSIDMGS